MFRIYSFGDVFPCWGFSLFELTLRRGFPAPVFGQYWGKHVEMKDGCWIHALSWPRVLVILPNNYKGCLLHSLYVTDS